MRFLPFAIAFMMLLASCTKSDQPVSTATTSSRYDIGDPQTLSERVSYAFGYILAASAGREYGSSVDFDYIVSGAMDFAEGRQRLSHSEMNQAIIEFQQMQAASKAAMSEEIAQENAEAAASFLEANKKRSAVHETDSGLQYEIVKTGSGKLAKYADNVEVDYQLTLLDGTIADSSYERGVSSSFSLSSVIPGFEEGIRLMREGDTYRFWIPPELGYGEYGAGAIEPNSLLIFDVDLIKVLD